jgi:hypothetical protein
MATNSPLRAPSMSKKNKTDVKRGVKAASKVKVKQGRKRNSLLDMATEWMKVNPGATLQESLLAAGFNAIDANSKNYRDQLSRRLRNDRRAEEEGVLEKDEFVQKVKVSCVERRCVPDTYIFCCFFCQPSHPPTSSFHRACGRRRRRSSCLK